MNQLIIGSIVAFLATFYAIPVIIKVAQLKKLYDEPDTVRKLHVKPIPSLGGLGMFIGFTLCLLLTVNFGAVQEFQYYLAAFLIIFFVGIKDDILVLSAMKKLICQCVVAGIIIFKGGIVISNMHGLLGIYQIETTTSYFLTFTTIIVTINAFNLIDGVDGLAGSVGFISCIAFGTFFLINNDMPYAILAFGFAASIIAFLIYNFQPAKIFMGDTGSLLLGLVNSILVIKFIEAGSGYALHPVSAAPAVGFSILLLPLMDTLRVFSYRIIKGKSPFSPDRNHIHHLLLDKGLTHRNVTYACSAITVGFIVAGYTLQALGTTTLIAVLITSFSVGIFSLYAAKPRTKMRVVKPVKQQNRVVSFFEKPANVAAETDA